MEKLKVDDKRVEFLQNYTLTTLKLTQDTWHEFLAAEENRTIVEKFFEQADICSLVLSRNAASQLVASFTYPSTLQYKAVYFVKRDKQVINVTNIQRLYVGDVPPSFVNVNAAVGVCEEIIYSLLTNKDNSKGWPKLVSEDVSRRTHKLKNEASVLEGLLKGRTLLPLPKTDEVLEDTSPAYRLSHSIGSNLMHAFETMIIDWAHQISEVLKKDSAQPILDGLNPRPNAEFDFWNDRLKNLECIHEQLMNPKVQKMAEILETAESAYWPALRNIFKDVEEGLKVADNIVLYLKPLQKMVDGVEKLNHSLLPLTQIQAVMHTVALTWANSEYYCHPERIIVILQEICNLLIYMAKNFLGSEDVMKGLQGEKGEKNKMLGKIRRSVTTLVTLKKTYDQCRQSMVRYFKVKDGRTKNWDFPTHLVFTRSDAFLQRLQEIEEVYKISVQFSKLKNIVIQGVRADAMESLVFCIYEEFLELIKMFTECTYDATDTDDTSFDVDFIKFQRHITDYERRIGTILCLAFDDCASPESAVKLFEMFDFMLKTPQIQSQISPKYKKMVEMFSLELDKTKLIYDGQMAAVGTGQGTPCITRNMPCVANQLTWVQGMQNRIQCLMTSFKAIHHPCMDTDEATLVFQKYDEMMDFLNNHCVKVNSQWTAKVDTDCQFSLDQPVLRRNPKTRVFTVNFSEQLVAVVREVKYLQGQVAIPPCASDVFAKREIFRKYVGNLNLIVSWYNQIQSTILSVELALVKEELKNIDEQLACAENSLCWNSEGVWDYIQKMRNTMHEFHSRLETAKTNVKMIHDIMDEWAMQAMFQRKDNKKESLLDLDGRQAALEKMYNNIKESGEKLHDLIAENKGLFRAEDCGEAWLEYVDYIDDEVLNGFFNVVHGSLNFLIENMLSENKHPLFEVRFELEDQKTAFYPSLAYGISDSLYDLVISLINDIYKTATLVPRMSVTSKFSYQVELEEISLLKDMHEDIMNEVVNAMNDAQDYCKFLYKYADLWQDDRDKFMEEFLFYDRVLTPEEIKVFGTDNIPTNPPTLIEFKDMIDTYESLYIEVKDLENSKVLRQWLQIDIKPFKHALLNVIKRWSWMFKQHLIDKVTDSLRELETFTKEVKSGLDKAVSEDLVGVMGHLKRVRDRQATIDNMFSPLKETIEFLKQYGEELPEEIHTLLQDLPEHWSNVKKTALQVRQNVAPLQVQEVNVIREKCQQFEIKQLEFREKFRQQPFFLFTCQSPYQALDKAQNNIAALEAEMEALFKLASLFEVFQTVPDYKQLKACQKDIVLLKNLWDKILLGLFTDMLKAFVTGASLTQVKGNMEDWKTTLWKNINLDQMEMESKKYAEDILGLDKEMRSWDAFTGLDNLVKNLITTLRTLRDLCNPAIKDRHWVQLMMATKLTFKTSNKTTFEDLLKLNLHKFEDEVHSIVDQAMNECEMEKILHELNNIWTALVFENEPHCRTGIMLLKPNNELVKALQDSQLQLQTLMTSKYIAHFLEDVSFWQQRLSTAESVISIWFRVQHTWTQLESIFIGSEDIRSQLPEESKRFDVIDTEFKDIMANVVKTANVVESTNKKGFLKKLEHLEAGLTVCEQVLAEHLEIKKTAFS